MTTASGSGALSGKVSTSISTGSTSAATASSIGNSAISTTSTIGISASVGRSLIIGGTCATTVGVGTACACVCGRLTAGVSGLPQFAFSTGLPVRLSTNTGVPFGKVRRTTISRLSGGA